jgi:hypothetical protein
VTVVRPIFGAALLATVLGLIFEFAVPASGRIVDIGAAVFGLATWIVPPLLAALSWHRKRSSLASVGFSRVASLLSSFARAPHPHLCARCKLGLARPAGHCGVLVIGDDLDLCRRTSPSAGQRGSK